jgi:hypothetical protein
MPWVRRDNHRPRVAWAVADTVLLGALVAAGLSMGVGTASAQPAAPKPPVTLFEENFEHGLGSTPVALPNYTGERGVKYTADPDWLTGCNGVIVQGNAPDSEQAASGCVASSFTGVRDLAKDLGEVDGSGDSNHAVTAYTENNPGANKVQFETVNPIPLSVHDRFLTFSVDAAAVNCRIASAPLFKFSLLDGTKDIPVGGDPINPCTDSRAKDVGTAKAGVFPAPAAILFSGSGVGIRMVNENGSGAGNDAAFDNIKILDATPSVAKSFSPESVTEGGTSKLTFTVTNTDELGAKDGWSFTDKLSSGLVVASSAHSTDCPGADVTAAAESSDIKAKGDLTEGMAECKITLTVRARPGTYDNGRANLTVVGLDRPPADKPAVVHFASVPVTG